MTEPNGNQPEWLRNSVLIWKEFDTNETIYQVFKRLAGISHNPYKKIDKWYGGGDSDVANLFKDGWIYVAKSSGGNEIRRFLK